VHTRGRRARLALCTILTLSLTCVAGASAHGFGYLQQFGSSGTGSGQFAGPTEIAVNQKTGRVYVSDSGNNRVQEFGPHGAFIRTFGSAQLFYAAGIAINAATGAVYVTSFDGDTVDEYTADGAFLNQFGSTGTGPGEFEYPSGIAVSPTSGDLYVADQIGPRVEVFTSGGTYLSQFGSLGSGPGQFNGPQDLAIDPWTGDVLVADQGQNRIESFTSTGSYISQFASPDAPGTLAFARGHDGVYVTNYAGNIVSFYSVAGVFRSHFGGAGTGHGEFNGPAGVAINAKLGLLYVSDYGNDRVEVFTLPRP
jgi:DNA-binding beta-propeller fold protein YncE